MCGQTEATLELLLELVVGKSSFMTEVANLAEQRLEAAHSQQELPENKVTQTEAKSRAGQRDLAGPEGTHTPQAALHRVCGCSGRGRTAPTAMR